METVISYKYPVGTKVYYKDFGYEPINEECHICKGEGALTRKDNVDIQCPNCGGTKIEQTSKRQTQIVKEGVVSYIVVEIKKRGNELTYYLTDLSQFNEERLFGTMEDAKKEFKTKYESIFRWEGYSSHRHEWDH